MRRQEGSRMLRRARKRDEACEPCDAGRRKPAPPGSNDAQFPSMTTVRLALANLSFPASPEDSVIAAERAIAEAGDARADLVCFPEAFVPGYRAPGRTLPPPDAPFL